MVINKKLCLSQDRSQISKKVAVKFKFCYIFLMELTDLKRNLVYCAVNPQRKSTDVLSSMPRPLKRDCFLLTHSIRAVSGRVASSVFVRRLNLKALGHVTVNKPVISIVYIVVHTQPLCSAQILVDGVNPLESYFQKSTNISAIVQHMSVSFVSLQSSRVHLQSSTVILRNIVEISMIRPIKNTAKSSFQKKFVYIT